VLHTHRTCTYNIYEASFSPGSVQQIMPYYLQVAHATTAVQTLEQSISSVGDIQVLVLLTLFSIQVTNHFHYENTIQYLSNEWLSL
jgi:hypothetical protein